MAIGAYVMLSGRGLSEVLRAAAQIEAAAGKAEPAQLDVVDAQATQAICYDPVARHPLCLTGSAPSTFKHPVVAAHVCINEVLISPTWNRSFVGVAELGGIRL